MAGYGSPEDKSPYFSIKALRIKFNPIVTILAVIAIWSFIITCVVVEDIGDEFDLWKEWVTRKWTWLYISSQDVWAVFMIVLYFSKYGKLKLGKDDEEPEYSTITWFTMLFACGIGIGLFFFGVSEPIWHYTDANRYIADQYTTDNELAQTAMNVTLYHWGIHGWIVYSVLGCLLGLVTYREGLPMTMKSCFYPLIGDKIYTWVGDAIDILSIITTLFGVCTSLGLGVIQINAGLNILNEDIPRNQDAQVIIIWVITAIATASTISGVGFGIRRLSEICFGVGMVLMALVLMLDNTWYLLNLYVQSIGYYLQWVLQLGFHCDAFELLGGSYGANDRGRAHVIKWNTTDGTRDMNWVQADDLKGDGPELWMNDWTIFYWGWWISWSPFVGMFIAKISRGRTIREFINGALTAPIVYTFLWLVIFGGAGFASERFAAQQGYCCNQDWHKDLFNTTLYPDGATTLFGAGTAGSSLSVTTSWNTFCTGECNACSTSTLTRYMGDLTYEQFYDNLRDTKAEGKGKDGSLGVWTTIQYYKGDGPWDDDRGVVRLSCLSKEEMWFYLMDSYYDIGVFLQVFSLIGIVLYFVTSSDSGSLIIDIMASNGDQEPPIPQRVFWAVTEGASATALLVAGTDDNALTALQTVAVCTGLPFTMVLCLACVSLYRCCAVTSGDYDAMAPSWKVHYIDFCTTLDYRLVLKWLISIPLGPYYSSVGGAKAWGQSRVFAICYAVFLYLMVLLFVVFHIIQVWVTGMWALGWLCFLMFITLMSAQRIAVRLHRGYLGNPFEDFFAVLFCYPSTCLQIQEEIEAGTLDQEAVEVSKVTSF